jgi:hypothetical protein
MNVKQLVTLLEIAYPDGLLPEEYEEALSKTIKALEYLTKGKPPVEKDIWDEPAPVVQAPVVEVPPAVKPAEPAAPDKKDAQLFDIKCSMPLKPGVMTHQQLFDLVTTANKKDTPKDPNDSLVDTQVLRSLTELSGFGKKNQVSVLQNVISAAWPSCSAQARVKQSLDRLVRRNKIRLNAAGSYVITPAAPAVPTLGARSPRRAEVQTKVLEYLEKERVGSTTEIMKHVLGHQPVAQSAAYDQVSQCLSRMVRAGTIAKVKHGVYAATKEDANVLRG